MMPEQKEEINKGLEDRCIRNYGYICRKTEKRCPHISNNFDFTKQIECRDYANVEAVIESEDNSAAAYSC